VYFSTFGKMCSELGFIVRHQLNGGDRIMALGFITAAVTRIYGCNGPFVKMENLRMC
jgi:hypothetical protein